MNYKKPAVLAKFKNHKLGPALTIWSSFCGGLAHGIIAMSCLYIDLNPLI